MVIVAWLLQIMHCDVVVEVVRLERHSAVALISRLKSLGEGLIVGGEVVHRLAHKSVFGGRGNSGRS